MTDCSTSIWQPLFNINMVLINVLHVINKIITNVKRQNDHGDIFST